MWRSSIRKWALGVGAVLALPFLVNGAAALAEQVVYGSLYAQGRPTALYPDEPGAPRLKPNSSVNGTHRQVNVNSHGLRGPEPEVPKPSGRTRIWALGGSSTYDVHAPTDSHTWPSRLEAELQARGVDADVMNGGRPGEVLMGSWDQLLALNDTLQPDVIVLYHGPNDLRQGLKQQLGDRAELICDQDVLPPIDVAAFRWLERWDSTPHPIPADWSSRRLTHWEDIERGLRNVLKEARRMGLRAVVASHALGPSDADGMLRYAEHMGLAPEGIEAAYAEYNQRAERIAVGERATFIDLAAEVPDTPENWGDPSHFAPVGSALAGRVLADALIREGVL